MRLASACNLRIVSMIRWLDVHHVVDLGADNIGADGVACLCEPSHKVQDVSQSANHARARSGRPALLRVMKGMP